MEVDSALSGTPLKEFRTKIQWRDMKNYAAAIGDNNPEYFCDEKEGGIIAHPMFTVAITWPIIGSINKFIDTDKFPTEVLSFLVHYTEHIIFHNPVRPDDELVINGEIAAILPHKAGTYLVLKLEAQNNTGLPVFTEFTGAMLRGVECKGGGQGEENLPEILKLDEEAQKADPEKVEWDKKVYIDRLAPYVYDGCTDIVFPIHTSEQFARAVGLPDIIYQGTATLAHCARELINKEGGENPLRLKEIYCRFTGMVIPDSNINIRALKTGQHQNTKQVFFDVENALGKKAISNGFANFAN
jgi:acyl dehydratase